MRPSGCATLLSCAILVLLAGPAASQTLYLGQQEVDTSDEGVMDAALGRCAELAAASPDARIAATFTHTQPAAPDPVAEAASGRDQPRAQEPAAEASDEDQIAAQDPAADMASGDDGPEVQDPVPETVPGAAEPAIDPATLSLEAGGAATFEESSEGIDLDAVTLEACKEAGLVY
ncbi:MAG: hypothetical protein Q8K28_14955 [Hoeflea sp.]|uniref:hypothetical protein n=1 Tax=Hoeflea sp. TaxID=1940281 RepID=UPI00273190B1|nr:hypothetical protein [Hoeflea sp.]MDP2121195.1 hypothetical protein [Hoeflea sp.]